jgi:hypothetical protein
VKEVKRVEETGVIAFDGVGFWGVQYEDGHSCAMAFGPIEKARISNPEFCPVPEYMTYKGSHDYEKLSKSRLVKIKKTTIYEIEDPS